MDLNVPCLEANYGYPALVRPRFQLLWREPHSFRRVIGIIKKPASKGVVSHSIENTEAP